MRLIGDLDADVTEAQRSADLACLGDWPIEVRSRESIIEAKLELVEHVGSRMKRDWTADCLRPRPKLVDPMAVVAMGMGDDDRVETIAAGCKQLLAKIGTTID